MLVKEFCNNDESGLFSQEFLDCLPKYCPDCGMPTEMSETLTGLRCSNARCPGKVGQRISAITTQLGIKDFGDARIESFLRKFKITNPLMIFSAVRCLQLRRQ